MRSLLLLSLLLALPVAADCLTATTSTRTVSISRFQQVNGTYVVDVTVSSTSMIQNVFNLPMSGTVNLQASPDGGATWCPEFGPYSFTLRATSTAITVNLPLLDSPTHRRIVATSTNAVDPNAAGLNVTVSYLPWLTVPTSTP